MELWKMYVTFMCKYLLIKYKRTMGHYVIWHNILNIKQSTVVLLLNNPSTNNQKHFVPSSFLICSRKSILYRLLQKVPIFLCCWRQHFSILSCPGWFSNVHFLRLASQDIRLRPASRSPSVLPCRINCRSRYLLLRTSGQSMPVFCPLR